jgi:hypothetical protein
MRKEKGNIPFLSRFDVSLRDPTRCNVWKWRFDGVNKLVRREARSAACRHNGLLC